MSGKFQNKYRIQSARMKNWDYGWNAEYFVTICTANRECYFGDIISTETNGLGISTMKLSEIGQIANLYWHEIPNHFPFVKLGAFVVMPNHVHGIIVIDRKEVDKDIINDHTNVVETPNLGVSTTTKTITGGRNAKWKPGVLGVIVNQYKRICTINARKILADFGWQSRFYDHIIRDDKSFRQISEYIKNNPANWKDDSFFEE